MALTLLHTADWHLGRRFPAFERDQELRLTRARLDAVGRILDLAESRNVDAVLCAGDLFDQPSPPEEWWGGVLREFQRRNWQRPLVLLPGNHDPLTPNSLYHPAHPFRARLPSYVHVVDAKGWQLGLGDNAVVFAAPCTSHAGQTDLATSLPRRESGDDRIRIGLVHGQTFDIEGHQTNFPIARGTAADRGLDYRADRVRRQLARRAEGHRGTTATARENRARTGQPRPAPSLSPGQGDRLGPCGSVVSKSPTALASPPRASTWHPA